MKEVSSPQELQSELMAIIASVSASESLDLEKVGAALENLAYRVASNNFRKAIMLFDDLLDEVESLDPHEISKANYGDLLSYHKTLTKALRNLESDMNQLRFRPTR